MLVGERRAGWRNNREKDSWTARTEWLPRAPSRRRFFREQKTWDLRKCAKAMTKKTRNLPLAGGD